MQFFHNFFSTQNAVLWRESRYFMYFYKGLFFLWGRKGGSADSHLAHNLRHMKGYFLMIFNVRKMLYFYAIRGILCIFTKGFFSWGRKEGSADSHPANNLRHQKCYFFIIFNIRKILYFNAIRGISCIFRKGRFFMGSEGGVRGFPPGP